MKSGERFVTIAAYVVESLAALRLMAQTSCVRGMIAALDAAEPTRPGSDSMLVYNLDPKMFYRFISGGYCRTHVHTFTICEPTKESHQLDAASLYGFAQSRSLHSRVKRNGSSTGTVSPTKRIRSKFSRRS